MDEKENEMKRSEIHRAGDALAQAAANRMGISPNTVTSGSLIDREVLVAVGKYLNQERLKEGSENR